MNCRRTEQSCFLEEIGEKMYAIDRMLTQLKNAKILEKVNGIVIGSIVPEEGRGLRTWEAILDEVLDDFRRPNHYGFSVRSHAPIHHAALWRNYEG